MTTPPASFLIAVDGPAASGKGTLARKLAAHYRFAYLDTGSLYRAVGLKALQRDPGGPSEDAAIAAAEALASELAETGNPAVLNDPALRSDATAEAASRVSAVAAVRRALLDLQRQFAQAPPGGAPGAVLDGRDIGTVICPQAPAKIFVDAAVEVRAQRRVKELQERGVHAIYTDVLADLKNRDARDRQRSASPLKLAAGAFVLDTTSLDPEAALARAIAYVDRCRQAV